MTIQQAQLEARFESYIRDGKPTVRGVFDRIENDDPYLELGTVESLIQKYEVLDVPVVSVVKGNMITGLLCEDYLESKKNSRRSPSNAQLYVARSSRSRFRSCSKNLSQRPINRRDVR